MKMIMLAVVVLAAFALTGMAADAGKEKKGNLRHVVSFKFKDGTSTADIQKVEKAFKEMSKKIKEVKGFEWGTNNSPENLNKGFTHAWILTFNTEAGRKIYLDHPEHKKFVDVAIPLIGEVFVIDFWSEK